jgi:hypothetical protein
MSYLKSLTSKDVIVTPFRVHKQFSSDTPGFNDDGISVFYGRNEDYLIRGGKYGTGSKPLVYNSIKQLYYSNFLQEGNNGLTSDVSTASFNPDGTVTGPRYTPNYINNIQSIDELRYFPTESYDSVNKKGQICVLSFPSKQFGEYIKPGSFTSDGAYDDGQGNVKFNSDNTIQGNIIYEAGILVYTGGEEGVVDEVDAIKFNNPQWESTVTIYETQYKCTIRANEFNYSLNPSLLSSSIKGQNKILESGSAQYADFVTGSDFSPYVTTIGLYNDNQELLAVAKLAQPLPTSQTTDTTILINIDR